MGFCYFSNIAVAALEALETGAARVAIWDFDAHHGNGTEDIVAGDPITEMSLAPEDFATFGHWLRETTIPSGAILEGGYSDELSELIDTFLTTWDP